MDRAFFENISIIGRETYAILCAEAYLGTVYPERDWTPILDVMWKVTESDARDEWAYSFCDIIPEYLFEPENFEVANFESLTKEEYVTYTRLLKDTDQNVNTIFEALYDIIMDYAYTPIPGVGEDTLDDLESVCTCLEGRNVPLPNKEQVAFSSFNERDGWGSSFESSFVRKR